jgi:hypothetical protein
VRELPLFDKPMEEVVRRNKEQDITGNHSQQSLEHLAGYDWITDLLQGHDTRHSDGSYE